MFVLNTLHALSRRHIIHKLVPIKVIHYVTENSEDLKFSYKAKAGSAVIFDEGGIHQGAGLGFRGRPALVEEAARGRPGRG